MFDTAPSHPPFVASAEVAQMLGLQGAPQFWRRRARLEREHGFPRPMPTSQRPLLWRREQVRAWIERQGTPRQPAAAAPEEAGNVVSLLRIARARARG